MIPTGASRRFVVLFLLAAAFVSVLFIGSHRERPDGLQPPPLVPTKGGELVAPKPPPLTGHAIAPKLGNATAKYVTHSSNEAL